MRHARSARSSERSERLDAAARREGEPVRAGSAAASSACNAGVEIGSQRMHGSDDGFGAVLREPRRPIGAILVAARQQDAAARKRGGVIARLTTAPPRRAAPQTAAPSVAGSALDARACTAPPRSSIATSSCVAARSEQ